MSDETVRSDLLNNLKRIAETGHVSHAYILEGDNAAALNSVAEEFAKLMGASAADVLFLEHEKPNLISVDDVRKSINESVYIKPYNSEHKVYIVREADKMNVQAQNALLKTLEEPPAYVVIILLAANAETFLQTILSRCVKFSMISEEGADRPDAEDSGAEINALVAEIIRALPTMDTKLMMDEVAKLEKAKLSAHAALEEFRLWFRDILLYKAAGDRSLLIHTNEVTAVKQVAERMSFESIEKVLAAVDRTAKRIDANVNSELSAELLLMTMRDGIKRKN